MIIPNIILRFFDLVFIFLKKRCTYILFVSCLLSGCAYKFSEGNSSSFRDYSIKDILSIRERISSLEKEKALKLIDSFSIFLEEDEENFKDFLETQKFLKKNEYVGKRIDNDALALKINSKKFKNFHPLNKAILHIAFSDELIDSGLYVESINQLNLAIKDVEDDQEKYKDIIRDIYYQLAYMSSFYLKEYSFSIKSIDKALELVSEKEEPLKYAKILERKSSIYRHNKKYETALLYFNEAENVLKNSNKYNYEDVYIKYFAKKVSLYYSLDDYYPENKSYKDSIISFFNNLDKRYNENKITKSAYRHFMKGNINSLIKLKQFKKAKKLINEFEVYYKKTNDCYNLALMNMSKYVYERNIINERKSFDDTSSYRRTLMNSYNHMKNCGKDVQHYGVMWSNVLYYLYDYDFTTGDYKNALKWNKVRNEYTIDKYKNKLQQLDFWRERGENQTAQIIKLKQEQLQYTKTRLIVFALLSLALLIALLWIYTLLSKNKKQKVAVAKANISLEESNKELTSLNQKLKNSSILISKQKEELEFNNKKLELKNNEIQKLLADNGRVLFSKILKISTYKDSVQKIILELNNIIDADKEIMPNQLFAVEKKLKTIFSEKEIWQDFRIQFEKTKPGFFKKLKEISPGLTVNELKHCSYIVFNLKTKDVASLINISHRSVETARYRIKKKFNLEKGQSLTNFLKSI